MAQQEPENPTGPLASPTNAATSTSAAALERRLAHLEAQVSQLESQSQSLAAELRALQHSTASPSAAMPQPSAHDRIAPQAAAQPIAQPIRSLPTPPAHPLFHSVPTSGGESLETRFGANVLSKVGVVLLLIGAAWFLKWAFDNRWIGPLGRVLAGLLAGAAVVLWSERFRRTGLAAFSYALKAVGTGVLYLSLWAAFQMYHLMPAWVALLAMVAATAWNATMALLQDAELLAAYALLGAYLTPALVSTGGDHEIFLFTYLFIIAAATLALLRARPWPRLVLGALPATAAYFFAWYIEHFQSSSAPPPSQADLTLAFALLLWAAFAAVPLVAQEEPGVISAIWIPIGAAAFGALAVYSTLAGSNGRALEPWYAVGFAAVYLLMTRVRRSSLVSAVHLSLGIVFLTLAIPLKLTGRGITAGWLAEAVALLWVSTLPQLEIAAVRALRWLACASLLLGVVGALIGPWLCAAPQQAFANRNFAASMGALAALAIARYLASRMSDTRATPLNGRTIAALSLILLNLVLLVAMYREIFLYFETSGPTLQASGLADRYADFCFSAWMMLQGATLLALGFWRRVALARWLGLILLAATVCKVFAWDMRHLGTGYRVISYLGLGAVLMAVSFAYQKDWLRLKEPLDDGRPPLASSSDEVRP